MQEVQNKLDELKKIISRMNSNTVGLIEASAKMEVKLRNTGLLGIELAIIDDELDRLIKEYSNKLNNKE